MKEIEKRIISVVGASGGWREKNIISRPHGIRKTETFNKDHKVYEVTPKDNKSEGFYYDDVTKKFV